MGSKGTGYKKLKSDGRKKTLLFSITKKDLDIQTFTSGGPGGQHQNRSRTGVRVIHKASGARAECRDERSQRENLERAFIKMSQTETFRSWHKLETARLRGFDKEARERVSLWVQPKNLKVEILEDGKWEEENHE